MSATLALIIFIIWLGNLHANEELYCCMFSTRALADGEMESKPPVLFVQIAEMSPPLCPEGTFSSEAVVRRVWLFYL